MNWYYADGDQQTGPITEEELVSLAQTGRLADETPVWREGMADWQPYGSVKNTSLLSRGPQDQPPPPPQGAGAAPLQGGEQAVCVECGNFFPKSEMISFQGATVCGNCKPAFFQRVKEGGVVAGNFTYAGFWIRAAAYILDSIVLFIVMLVLGLMLGLAMVGDPEAASVANVFVQMAVSAAYATFFIGKYGATPGKMALSIKVVMPDGSRVSYGRAFGRFLAEILSALILFIGYIIAAFDSEKRALHDHICNTRVIRE